MNRDWLAVQQWHTDRIVAKIVRYLKISS